MDLNQYMPQPDAATATPPATGAVPEASSGSQDLTTGGAATVVATAPPSVPVTAATDDIVDRWFNTAFPGSGLCETTDQWNRMVTLKDQLKTLLRQ